MLTNMRNGPEVATVTVPEAAALLRVHVATLRRWIRDGQVPAIRPHPKGRFRIAVADLDALRERVA